MNLSRSSGPELLPRIPDDSISSLLTDYIRSQRYESLRWRWLNYERFYNYNDPLRQLLYVEERLFNDIERYFQQLEDPLLRRSFYWTMQIFVELPPTDYFRRLIPGFNSLAIGFFDPETERDDFGIIIYVNSMTDQEIMLPFESLYVGERAFPIVIRRIFEELHQPDPKDGTGACWGKSRLNSGTLGPGIVTAKHVTGNRIGAPMSMSCGCMGTVIDVGPDGVDAALVQCTCKPSKLNKIDCVPFVAPWIDVTFSGAESGTISTKVTDVSNTHGVYGSSLLPVRVSLADHGQKGDSGSLVIDNSGKAIGLYIGMYTDLRRVDGGIAQHAYQIELTMDMELYNGH